MTRPPVGLGAAIGGHYRAAPARAEEKRRQGSEGTDSILTARVRALADKADANPQILQLLPPRQRTEVEAYRAWRDSRTTDDTNGDDN